MDETYRLVYESVDQEIFGSFKIAPLTHGAVAAHPNSPLAESPGLPLKKRGYKTKGEALADPEVIKISDGYGMISNVVTNEPYCRT